MDEITDKGVRDIKFMHWKELSIYGINFKCLRQGVSGEFGFEIWGPMKNAKKIFTSVLEKGKKYNIRRLGARAKCVNHVRFPDVPSELSRAFSLDTET